jgi:hypothetical protein
MALSGCHQMFIEGGSSRVTQGNCRHGSSQFGFFANGVS